jgi:hypothetical protein
MGAAALRVVLEVAVGSVQRSERGNAFRTWKVRLLSSPRAPESYKDKNEAAAFTEART